MGATGERPIAGGPGTLGPWRSCPAPARLVILWRSPGLVGQRGRHGRICSVVTDALLRSAKRCLRAACRHAGAS
eukprot:13605429-Alexandrium_andersonii.AAC.1